MISNPHKSKFILFEGIDGSGKSEQYTRTQNYLNEIWPRVAIKYCKEPDINRPVGKQIYQILGNNHPNYNIDKMKPFHLQAFYIEDRMTNYRDNIIASLQSGSHVIQDRGVPSSLCYGSETHEDFYDFMELHNRVFSAAQVPFIWPDLVMIFDIPAELAIKRMLSGNKKLDKFETKAKLTKVRNNYLKFAKKYPNCRIINASGSPEEIFKVTRGAVVDILGLKK